MKHTLFFGLATTLAAALASTAACAYPRPGQELTPQERSALAPQPTVHIEGQTLTLMPPPAGSAPGEETWVVNAQGLVGRSHHTVMVANAPTAEVQRALQDTQLPHLRSSELVAHLNLATLRYASLQDALSARSRLAQLLPRAKVVVPIEYATPKKR